MSFAQSNIKEEFFAAVHLQQEKLQVASLSDKQNGHWMRAAVVTMGWVSGWLSEYEEINRSVIKDVLKREMPNEKVRQYAWSGFEEVCQRLSIN